MPDKPTGKVCPECGVSLDDLDVVGHSLTHYPEYLDPAKSGKDARNRQQLLLKGGVTVDEYNKLHKEG